MKQRRFVILIVFLLCLFTLTACHTDSGEGSETAAQTPSTTETAPVTEPVHVTDPAPVTETEAVTQITETTAAVPDDTTAIVAPETEPSEETAITPTEITRGDVDYCLSNMPIIFLYGYENDYSASHELELLIGMGEGAIPHLLAVAEETRRYDSPGYDHQTFLKALFAIGIIDPTAFADLPIAEYLIPSADGSYVWFEQEDLIFDCVNRRILCCKYLPFGNVLAAKFGIAVNQNVTETEFLSWESKTAVRLGFYVASGESDIGTIMGECTYDFPADTQLSLTYTTEFEPNLGPVPYDDVSKTVCEQLDILMEAPDAYEASVYIDAHPEAYNTIVSLGNAALPYLQQIIDETPKRMIYRICMAKTLAYAINPVLYDIVIPSPDTAYQLRIGVKNFFSSNMFEVGIEYGGVTLTDASGAVLAADATELLLHPEISWSPDSRYAVINHGHLKYGGGTPLVIDTNAKTVMPVSDILDAVAAACGLESIELYSIFTETAPWEADGVRISFHIMTHAASNPGFIDGYCSVDGTTGAVTETVIESYETPQPLQ